MLQESYRFPNGGHEVRIVRKQEILDCIDANITDKEIALAIIEKLELDCSNFLREGKWCGIPHMGNIRIPVARQYRKSEEQQALLEDVKNEDTDTYIMFRRQLNAHNEQKARFLKSYNYLVSIMINRHPTYYKTLCKEKSFNVARMLMYGLGKIRVITEEYKHLYYE